MRSKFPIVNSVLVSGFLLLLMVPFAVQLLRYTADGNDVLDEKRIFAKAPSLPRKLDDWLKFPTEFEAYFKDNFGLRAPLLSIAIALKRALGISPNEHSLSGKEGWVFVARPNFTDRLKEFSPMDAEQLNDFSQRMNRLTDILQQQGIVFVHFVAPEKQSIYPEYLPTGENIRVPTPLEQLNRKLRNSDAYVDVKKILLREKSRRADRFLYNKIDSHWNCLGAYFVYREVVTKGLNSRGLQLPVVSESEFVFRNKSDFDKQDLFSTDFWLSSLAKQDTKYECLLDESPLIEMRLPDGTIVPNINGEIGTPEATFSNLFVLYYNWRSSNKQETAKLRAVIVRDSFASRLVSYFNRTFSEVAYLHHMSLENERSLTAFIEKFKPDVVIYEYAERRLASPEAEVLEPIERGLQDLKTRRN